MDEHRPKVSDISETAAKAASAAAVKAKAALEQSNGNTHEPHHAAGAMPTRVKNAADDAVENEGRSGRGARLSGGEYRRAGAASGGRGS